MRDSAVLTENVEIAKRAIAAWQTGGVEAILEFLDEDVEYRPLDESPVHGREGVRQYYARWLEPWEEYSVAASDYQGDDDKVVIAITVRGRGRESGIEVSMDFWSAFWLRDGKTTRWDEFMTKAEALEASGPGASDSI